MLEGHPMFKNYDFTLCGDADASIISDSLTFDSHNCKPTIVHVA